MSTNDFYYKFREWEIPPRMGDILDRYLQHGYHPGTFIMHVLSNDFVRAAGHADDENLMNLQAYMYWLYNECPNNAWGTRQKVYDYMEEKRGVPWPECSICRQRHSTDIQHPCE